MVDGGPGLRWHPSAAAFKTLHDEGKLTVVPAVGYRDADQSHFTSRHYWEVGATNPGSRTGWMGRYLDRVGSPDNPLQGLYLDGELAPSLATGKAPVAALRGADSTVLGARRLGRGRARDAGTLAPLGRARGARGKALGAIAGTAAQPNRLRQQLAPFNGAGITSPVAYPQHRAASRSGSPGLAAMLGAGLPLRCVALTASGHVRHPRRPG